MKSTLLKLVTGFRDLQNYSEWSGDICQRTKCFDAILDLISSETSTTIDVLSKITEWSKKDITIKVNVDIKAQLAGVREILILDIKSRIMVWACETLARKMCERVNYEMLTHGNVKFDRILSS